MRLVGTLLAAEGDIGVAAPSDRSIPIIRAPVLVSGTKALERDGRFQEGAVTAEVLPGKQSPSICLSTDVLKELFSHLACEQTVPILGEGGGMPDGF